MLDIFLERLRQGARTVAYPREAPVLPPRFRGRPLIDASLCASTAGCAECAKVCPTGAIVFERGQPVLDMGFCIFCGLCSRACQANALVFTRDWRLATTERQALLVRPSDVSTIGFEENAGENGSNTSFSTGERTGIAPLPVKPALPMADRFARSFRLRQVSAAGCGACEADLNVLGTVVFDLARFGIDYVASPRHADALVITGPVPRNMREALLKCDRATPRPRAVIAVGACAISGGVFRSPQAGTSLQESEGTPEIMPVDLFIPGCPPHPYTNLDGLLRFLGRI